MNLITFLENLTGKWFVQRTTYQINSEEVITNKGYITIQYTKDSINTINLNNLKNHKELSLNLITQIIWSNNKNITTNDLSSLLLIPYKSNSNKFVRILNRNSILEGNYINIKNKSSNHNEYYVILIKDYDSTTYEKIWFPNNNLKLSITSFFKNNQCISTSFSSEIRMLEV